LGLNRLPPKQLHNVVRRLGYLFRASGSGKLFAKVGAALALKNGKVVDRAELREFVKYRIVAYKYPHQLWLVDILPKAPTGKTATRNRDPDNGIRAVITRRAPSAGPGLGQRTLSVVSSVSGDLRRDFLTEERLQPVLRPRHRVRVAWRALTSNGRAPAERGCVEAALHSSVQSPVLFA
jgi:hypothetical protein